MTKTELVEILEDLPDDSEISFSLEGNEKVIKFLDIEVLNEEIVIYLEEE